MKVRIAGGREVELNIGDRVDYQHSYANEPVMVIGIRPSSNGFALTYEGIQKRCQLRHHRDAIKKYNIGPEWSDDTWFFTNDLSLITKVYPAKRCSHKASGQSCIQARSAAWGEDGYVAPKGAAFEFL